MLPDVLKAIILEEFDIYLALFRIAYMNSTFYFILWKAIEFFENVSQPLLIDLFVFSNRTDKI